MMMMMGIYPEKKNLVYKYSVQVPWRRPGQATLQYQHEKNQDRHRVSSRHSSLVHFHRIAVLDRRGRRIVPRGPILLVILLICTRLRPRFRLPRLWIEESLRDPAGREPDGPDVAA